ncbi:MAG: OmpH family outer membrane protein [Planctomycetota bacterium]
MLQLALLAVLGVWGAAALMFSLQNATAQPAPVPAADNSAAQPAPADPPPAQPAAGTHIAFINLESVIRNYPRWWVGYDKLRAESDAREKTLKETEAALQSLKKQIEGGDAVAPNVFQDYAQRSTRLELDKRKLKSDIEKKMRELSTAVYNDMYDMVENLTKGKYDMVLGVSEKEIRTGTQGEFFQKMTVRAVVIHNPAAEITTEVLLQLTAKSIKDGIITLDEVNKRRKEQSLKQLEWKGDKLVEKAGQ